MFAADPELNVRACSAATLRSQMNQFAHPFLVDGDKISPLTDEC